MKNNKTDVILKKALYDAMKREVDTYDEPDIEDHHCFSEEFELKMNQLIKTHKRKHIIVKKFSMMGAALAAVCIVCMCTLCTHIDAEHNPFIKQVMKFIYGGSETDITYEFDSEVPDSIEEKYYPEYIPDGFKLETSFENEKTINLGYKDDKKNIIHYNQCVIQGSNFSLNAEDTEIKYIDINGYNGIYYYILGAHNFVWNNGKYHFSVTSNLDINTVEKIINSLKVKKIKFHNSNDKVVTYH